MRSPRRMRFLVAFALVAGFVGASQPQLDPARVRGWVDHKLAERRSDVPRVPILLSYRDDHQRGHPWTPDDVVGLLRRRPEAFVFVGALSGYPIGSPLYRAMGGKVNRWQKAIADWNTTSDPDLDPARICINWRPDVVFKHIDGGEGENSCGSLLDESQCAPSPCSAHPDNPCTRWEGDMARHWGAAAARFDTGWLARIPAILWHSISRKYHDGQDFCDGAGHTWGPMTDRREICAANTPERKVVLYGKTDPAKRRLAGVSGVALDLRTPEAREWNARRLLSMLVDFGFGPGEPGCVILGYKPGLWSHYDGPDAGKRCPADEVNSWSGFETPANAAGCWGGAVVPTPYGPGEFEKAMNEQMRAVFRLLEASVPERLREKGGAGDRWGRIQFVTTERPETRGQIWWIWEPDVQSRLLGEMRSERTGLSGP